MNGEAPIYMRITVNGDRWEFSLKRSIHSGHWDGAKEKAKKNASDPGGLNDYLELMKRKIYEIRKELIDDNIPVTTDEIKERYLSNNAKFKGLLEVFSEHNRRCEDLVGNGYAATTVGKFKYTFNYLFQW